MWGPLSRGNFTGDNCLRVIISGQLFYGANDLEGNNQGDKFWGAIAPPRIIAPKENCPGGNYPVPVVNFVLCPKF